MYPKTWKAVVVALIFSMLLGPVAMAQDVPDDAVPAAYLPTIAGSSSASSANTTETLTISEADQAAALAFWTHDMLAEATAAPMMVQSGPMPMAEAAVAAADGPPGFTAPLRPAKDAEAVARAAYPEEWQVNDLTEADYALFDDEIAAAIAAEQLSPMAEDGTSQLYTSYIANLPSGTQTITPHRWIGRLSFTTPTGTSYCSATAIGGNNIVTAAHCLYDTPSRNRWYTNFVFAPAYRNGSAPYRTFAATRCTIMTGWVNLSGSFNTNTWSRHDVGVCTMGRNSASQTLNGAVGGAATAWNYGYVRHVFSLGYPWRNTSNAALSWAGAYLRLCSAESFTQSTDVRGMGCNWGPGASGGPWIDNTTLAYPTTYGTNGYAPGLNTGYVTGVNSSIYYGTQNIYAPRFTTANFRAICNVRGC